MITSFAFLLHGRLKMKKVSSNSMGPFKKDGTVYELKDKTAFEPMEYAPTQPDQWLGALYYNMIETKRKKARRGCCLDTMGRWQNRLKVVDVLSTTKKESRSLGQNFLISDGKRPDTKTRVGAQVFFSGQCQF